MERFSQTAHQMTPTNPKDVVRESNCAHVLKHHHELTGSSRVESPFEISDAKTERKEERLRDLFFS
jgi:hypothetical protein